MESFPEMTNKVTTLVRGTGIEDPGPVLGEDAGSRWHDPEVPERARRRTFTAKYKAEILAAYDAAPDGEKGALLRREGCGAGGLLPAAPAQSGTATAGANPARRACPAAGAEPVRAAGGPGPAAQRPVRRPRAGRGVGHAARRRRLPRVDLHVLPAAAPDRRDPRAAARPPTRPRSSRSWWPPRRIRCGRGTSPS